MKHCGAIDLTHQLDSNRDGEPLADTDKLKKCTIRRLISAITTNEDMLSHDFLTRSNEHRGNGNDV